MLPVTPLPEGIAADIVRSLQKRYPGRYLLIDFWGMNCGPCRAAIQSSKALREEIARRWDIKLVFIADEETAEGSEAYHKYVSEWLPAGAESIMPMRTPSAPYFSIRPMGSGELPRLFDILRPSLSRTIPVK